MRAYFLGLVGAVSLACATPAPERSVEPGPAVSGTAVPVRPGVPDSEIGLAKGTVFETIVPPPMVENNVEPGDGTLVAPAYPGAPTPVPHDVRDLLPITWGENSCIDCHTEYETKEPGEATPVPKSHYVDLRRARDAVQEEVVGARYVCTACHLQHADVAPLVGLTGD